MKLYIIISSIILALFIIGCKEESSSPTSSKTIKSGYVETNKSTEKQFQVIYSQEEFDKVYSSIYSGNAPKINFEKNCVFSFILGDRLSKDYSTKITAIQEEKVHIVVSLETTIVNENCLEEKKQVLPFNIVTSSGTSYKDVIFQESVKVIECSDENLSNTFETVSFREVDLMSSYGDLSYGVNKRLDVVQDSETFEYIYYNHINPLGYDKALPYIDFENETLIALFMRLYGYDGNDIKVTSVKEYNSYIEVEIENTLIGAGCPAGAAMSAPATFVAIPKTSKEIVFKEYANVDHCD